MKLLRALDENLNQLHQLVESLSDDQLRAKNVHTSNASIGMHLRHILEFYGCLAEQFPQGYVNYDERKRDLALETSCRAILDKIEELKVYFFELSDAPITFKASYSANDDEAEEHSSSRLRELSYCLEHSIHHMAIIKLSCYLLNIPFLVGDTFGVAYSTQRNTQKQCAQ